MNKNGLFPNLILVCVTIIGISGVLSGVKHHETWRIVLGAITLGLLMTGQIIKGIKTYKQKV